MTETAEKTYEVGPWVLDDLFPGLGTPEIDKALKQIDQDLEKFESYRDKLSPDMDIEDFMDALTLGEKISLNITKLFQFSFLKFSEDTQNSEAATFRSKVQQLGADVSNRSLFFDLWWKTLDDDQAKKFQDNSGEYSYYLHAIRNFKPYTLSEAEEKIINTKNVTGARGLNSLYSAITNRYVFNLTVDGEEKELTQGELLQHVYSSDADMRAAAYKELWRVYGNDGPILGLIYQNYVRDYYNENLEMRGMKNVMSHRNLNNDIPDEVIDVLLESCKKNTTIFQRFFKLKAKWLGMEKLRRYDIYAPSGKSSDKNYDFNEAVHMTLDAFREFDPVVAKAAQRVLDEKHIHSEVQKGKMSGAYNWGVDPALTPFVLMNYSGSARDIATLAHELGHSLHNMMASDQTFYNFGSAIPLAETASTFAEILLTDKLLAEEEDDSVRKDILIAQMNDAFATIQRQAFFALFERDAIQAVHDGASVDEICDIYYKNLEEQFGDAVELSEDFKWEWTYASIFFDRPFYVYGYAFGQLLVFALYQQYKDEGDSFIPRYLDILRAGSSMAPVDILDRAGVDVRTPEFWQGGFDVISGILDRLEAME